MKIKYFTTAIVMTLVLLTGCTKESTEDCFSGLKLDFDFTLNTDNKNLFGEKVNRVRVYLFDDKGVLRLQAIDNGKKLEYSFLEDGKVRTITSVNTFGGLPDNYVMNLEEVPAGKYTIISFAGSGIEDKTTYFHGQMIKANTHEFKKEITLGVTTKDDIRMFLKCSENGSIISPEMTDIDDLWFGAVGERNPKSSVYALETVEIKFGEITERHIELIRNTNILKVTVTGLDKIIKGSIGEGEFKIWTVASNGRYKYTNFVGDNARPILYTPVKFLQDEAKVAADIKMVRMEMDRHSAEPILLYVEAPNGRRFPEKPIDVIKILMQARDSATDNYIYNTQSDFDKIYEHPIELRLNSQLEVTIYIGDWKIVNVIPAG